MKNEKSNSKKKKWLKFRHKVVRALLAMPIRILCSLKYNITVTPYRDKERRPCLILYNHQTAFDQFFVGLAFKQPVYYLASEDLFSKGWLSSLIKYLVEPIPIKKQTTDVKAIINCMRVVKEGGTIAIAPEGNRTYSGETGYMSPAIAPLARKLGLPIMLLRIEGGYGVQPRWSDVTRRGKMRAYVSRVIESEEYAALTDDGLMQIIRDELYVNEAVADGEFKSKKSAEYLERAIFYCPDCGLSSFESHGDTIECTRCKKKIKYLPTKELVGINCDFPYRFVLDWYKAQESFVNSFDPTLHLDLPIYSDKAALREEIPYEKKILLSNSSDISLFGNRIEINAHEQLVFPFDECSAITVLGRNKLNVYHGGKIYQLKGNKRFCALKYVNIYHRYKNLLKGENNEFLGL